MLRLERRSLNGAIGLENSLAVATLYDINAELKTQA